MQPCWFKIMGSDKVKNSAGRHGRFSTRVLRARPLPPLPPSGVAQEGAAPLRGGGVPLPLRHGWALGGFKQFCAQAALPGSVLGSALLFS